MAVRCRAFKYQLQPTAKQTYTLERLVVGQRELYNAALEERIGAWRWERRSVTRYDQYRTHTGLRAVRPETLTFGVTVCRGTLNRLDLAFKAFFRRVKAGQAPGFPRFKGPHRFDSVSWPDVSRWKVDEAQHRLSLQGVGHLKYRKNRPVRGTPKTITVRREGRRWFVTVFCVSVPAQPLPDTGQVAGIDVGVARLATVSDGTTIPNPRPGQRASQRLAAAQRIGAVHRKVARRRLDHLHKASRFLVDRDAGWGMMLRMVAYKTEDAGRHVIAVDARHTSQRCGHQADADEHAAGNILRAGLAQREARAGREARDVA